MSRRYTDDDCRLRCRACDSYVKAGKRCGQCHNRKKAAAAAVQQVADEAAREERRRQRSARRQSWRTRQLRSYTGRVLAMRGAERLAFMEGNPVSGLFR